MAAFWSGLGSGLANYGKQRLMGSRGVRGLMPPHLTTAQQSTGAFSPPMDATPAQDDGSGGADLGVEQFAGGKIVTQPTTALVGEKGPEAIVPLNAAPGQKLSTSMMGGPQVTKSRFRAVTGPNALAHTSPIKGDIPLRPNRFMR